MKSFIKSLFSSIALALIPMCVVALLISVAAGELVLPNTDALKFLGIAVFVMSFFRALALTFDEDHSEQEKA